MILDSKRAKNRRVISVRTDMRAGINFRDCDDVLTYCQNEICGMIRDRPTEFSRCTMNVCRPAYIRCLEEQKPE